MKVLSWDVGIINLAYCLLDVSKTIEIINGVETENIKYNIHKWGLIDLSNKEEQKKLCHICQKNASLKYLDISDNQEKYLCKTHAKKYEPPDIPDIDSFFITHKNHSDTCEQCDKNVKRTCQNHQFCSTHGRNYYNKLTKNIKLSNIKKIKTNFDIGILRHKLIIELDKRPELFTAEKIVIENQPSLKNPRMKAISSTIYDYYLIRGVVDKHFNSQINKVLYMSPSNKIKLSKDKKIVKEADKTKKYKLTKKLAVDYVKALLDTDLKNFKDYFLSIKKKDDLADAFLQGAYFLLKMT